MSSWALGILFLLELLEPILLPVSLRKPRLSVAAVQARWIYLCALTEVYARAHCWHTDQPITARQEPHSDQWEVHKHIHRTSVLWEITAAGDKEQIQFERLRIISKICDGLTHTSPPTSAQTPLNSVWVSRLQVFPEVGLHTKHWYVQQEETVIS